MVKKTVEDFTNLEICLIAEMKMAEISLETMNNILGLLEGETTTQKRMLGWLRKMRMEKQQIQENQILSKLAEISNSKN